MREAQSPFGDQNGGPLPALQPAPTFGAVGVFQAKAGLVSLSHLGAVQCQQIIVGKDLDAVEVSVGTGAEHRTGAWPGSTWLAQATPAQLLAGQHPGTQQITTLKPNKAVMTVLAQTLLITPAGTASWGGVPPCPAWPKEGAAPCQPLPMGHSPVALVPSPGVSPHPGSEIGSSQVVDLGGEAKEAAVAIGPLHVVSRAREAALLVGTVQQPQGSVLQVGCLLHQLGVHHQVWGIWHGEDQQGLRRCSPPCIAPPTLLQEKGGPPSQQYPLGSCYSRAVQVTPAEKRPPPLGQWTGPWRWHCWRASSVPAQRTPLITTRVASGLPAQYHVS